ncbi:MAG: hypothetical protein J5802_09525 [Butyrivibrio sp.]|nr:hypothetical protein [Butyrivibrio sp.]
MAENKVFMDTNVFTEIVDEIRGAASDCVLPDRALNSMSAWEGTDAGQEIIKLIKSINKTADLYRKEASGALPRALLTLRDSMIAVDKEVSESLSVDTASSSGGMKIERKR